jgi:hypothetical protein
VTAILVGGLKCRTQFWKGTTQGSFQQSLVEIGSVVSEEKIFFGWFSSKNMSGGSALRPRWPPQPNLAQHRTLWEIHIKIFSSEITGPIATKLWWYGQQSLVEIGSVVSEKIFFKFHPPFFLFLAWWPSWLEVGITGHNFGRGPSKDHTTKVWLQLAQWSIKIFLSEIICSIRTKC